MAKAKPTAQETQVRFLRYLAVGGSTAVVQFSTLAGLKALLSPVPAFSCAFAIATSFHYACNRFWALKSKRTDTRRQLIEYLCAIAVSYLINVCIFKFAQGILHLGVMWSAVVAVPPATVVVFLLLNFHVFHPTRGARE